MISTPLWKGKLTGSKQGACLKNPGLLVVRQKESGKKGTYKSPKKGYACLVSKQYAVTAAFLIKGLENKNDFGGLFVTRGLSSLDIVKIWCHDQYNPENQFEYDIGIIKVNNLTNLTSFVI